MLEALAGLFEARALLAQRTIAATYAADAVRATGRAGAYTESAREVRRLVARLREIE